MHSLHKIATTSTSPSASLQSSISGVNLHSLAEPACPTAALSRASCDCSGAAPTDKTKWKERRNREGWTVYLLGMGGRGLLVLRSIIWGMCVYNLSYLLFLDFPFFPVLFPVLSSPTSSWLLWIQAQTRASCGRSWLQKRHCSACLGRLAVRETQIVWWDGSFLRTGQAFGEQQVLHAGHPMFGETDIDIQEPEVERSEAATQHRTSYAVFEESNTSYLEPSASIGERRGAK